MTELVSVIFFPILFYSICTCFQSPVLSVLPYNAFFYLFGGVKCILFITLMKKFRKVEFVNTVSTACILRC